MPPFALIRMRNLLQAPLPPLQQVLVLVLVAVLLLAQVRVQVQWARLWSTRP